MVAELRPPIQASSPAAVGFRDGQHPPFLRFFRRQWLAVRATDALLTGAPVALVRGRQRLLAVELYAWASRPARFAELVVGPIGIFLATAWWWAGNGSAWLPIALVLGLASFSAYRSAAPDSVAAAGRSPSWRSWRALLATPKK